MTTAAAKLMTADEFYEWCHLPENQDRHFELERGEVVEMPQPGERHGFVCCNTGRILGNYTFQQKKGYVCSNDAGILWERDPDTVRGPDLFYYDDLRRYDQLNIKYSDRIPQLVVEVVSPTDRWSKMIRRFSQFLQLGVGMVWVIHPEERTVTVLRPGQLPQVLDENEELTGNSLLPDFRCRVADFFFMPGETPP